MLVTKAGFSITSMQYWLVVVPGVCVVGLVWLVVVLGRILLGVVPEKEVAFEVEPVLWDMVCDDVPVGRVVVGVVCEVVIEVVPEVVVGVVFDVVCDVFPVVCEVVLDSVPVVWTVERDALPVVRDVVTVETEPSFEVVRVV